MEIAMIIKTVKEYGKRQRIDINKSDGFSADDKVVLVPAEKYDKIKQDIMDLQTELMTARNESEMMAEVNAKLTEQIEDERNRKINLKEIIKDAVTPIDNHYQKEISKKDDELKQLKLQLKAMEQKTNQYNLDMQGLNTIDIAIFRKHKKLIQKYNEEITLIGKNPEVIAADGTALPGDDVDQEQK